MVLLVTRSERSESCVEHLTASLHEQVSPVSSLRRAVALVRTADYRVVVVDETLLDTDPALAAVLQEALQATVPVYLNFGVTNEERLLREVRRALNREEMVRVEARRMAEASVRNEVRSSLSGLLLACDLVLKERTLSPEVREKMIRIRESALEVVSGASLEATGARA
jgi:hypothetical protein